MEKTTFIKRSEPFTFDDIINVIRELSYSQGFYGRLLRSIEELKENDIDSFNEFKELMENQKFTDSLDVVLYFET